MKILQISNRLLSISVIGRANVLILKPHRYYNTYSEHILSTDPNHFLLLSSTDIRSFHSCAILYDDKSKIEKTVNLLKIDKINEEKAKQTVSKLSPTIIAPIIRSDTSLATPTSAESAIVKRKYLRERFVNELKHYYNGFKLLSIETKIAFRLLRQVLNGHTLTRRERKQFARTAADLFRLVPFSVFIIVPFMEFTLPIFLKLFPSMLPSTFKEADKEQEKLKKQIKAKLEVAKFLQNTLEATALKSKNKRSDDAIPIQFVDFMKKVRSAGAQPSTEEIMKFSSLFENKSTLDNLNRPQLVALCKLIGISSIGPDYYLRFTLHLKLRNLEADDKLIESEGIENLNVEELQAACRERVMRSYGVSIERLRSQLQQWLDLHLNKRIPSTILLLSRALYLPENISQENVLKAAIQSLPKSIDNVTAVKLAQVSGERVDNTQRIEYIKREDEAIKKEQQDKVKNKILIEDEIKKKKLDIPKAEILVDMRKQEKKYEQHIDVGQFETAFGQLVHQKVKEIRDLKADVKEFETIAATKQFIHLSETLADKALSKHIDKLVKNLDQSVQTLDKKQDTLQDEVSLKNNQIQQNKDFFTEKRNILVSTQEFVNTIRQIQNVSNQSIDVQVWDIIHQIDKDGFIEADEILKALKIIGNEKLEISKKNLKEIINLVRKEHIVEEKEKFEAKIKQQSIINSINHIDKTQKLTKKI